MTNIHWGFVSARHCAEHLLRAIIISLNPHHCGTGFDHLYLTDEETESRKD